MKKFNIKLSLAASAVILGLLSGCQPEMSSTDDYAKLSLAQSRTEARNSVENLMGRLVFYRLAEMEYKASDLFANGDPDLKIQIPPGIFEGPDAALRVFGDPNGKPPAERPGEMHYHTLVSPVVEVAGDGQTAKAIWMSPGAVSRVRGGSANASWAWTKYAADFKQVDGQWKIWHFRVGTVFNTPYDKPWTELGDVPHMMAPPKASDGEKPKGPPGGGMPKADRPNHEPGNYTTSTVQTLEPVPPLPYQTWDDSMSYVK